MVEITPVDDNDDDIFSIESLVGPQLLKEVNKPTVATSTGAFGSNKTKKKKKTDKASSSSDNNNPPLLGLYFSASWCPPCQRFTPLLIDFYKIAKEVSPNDFEIVFISSDKNQEEFDEYYRKMPWLAIPSVEGSAQIKSDLAAKIGVKGIPALAIIDGKTGEFIAGGTARDDVIRVTTTSTGEKIEKCDPGQVKAVLGKWKSAERSTMHDAPRLMETGKMQQSTIGKVLSFIAKNPMVIFGAIYLYQWLKRKYLSEDEIANDEKPPSIDETSDNDNNEF